MILRGVALFILIWIDRRRGVRRDWLHWAGIIVEALDVAMTLLNTVANRYFFR